MTSPTVRSHTARKQWPCAYGNDTIEPGERYQSQTWPPWTMTPVDVTDEGETIYDQLGEWATERFHAACRDRAEAGS